MKRTYGLLGWFLHYSFLSMLGMLGISGYILADTFFVSLGLGADGLAALNLAIPIYSLIHGSGLLLGMGGATKYSVYKSQGEREKANKVFFHGVFLSGCFALIFVAAGCFLWRSITQWMGADGAVFDMTGQYLRVLLLFSPAFLLNDLLLCFVRNDGAPGLSMLAMIGGSLSNVALDYLFIFPMEMGIFGAVLATGLAPVISMAVLSVHWRRKKNGFRLEKTKPSGRMTASIFSLGFPSLVAQLSSGVVMVLFNQLILGLRGNLGVAAYGVVANLSLVAVAVFQGIEQGTQPLLSRCYGKGDFIGIRRLLGYSMGTVLLLSFCLYAAIWGFSGPVAAAFNSQGNPALQQMAVEGLRLYFLALPFVGINMILSVLFTSTQSPGPAHWISLLRGLIVIVPMALLLSRLWGMEGVWLSYPAAEGLVAGFGGWLYRGYRKKQLMMLKNHMGVEERLAEMKSKGERVSQ